MDKFFIETGGDSLRISTIKDNINNLYFDVTSGNNVIFMEFDLQKAKEIADFILLIHTQILLL